MPHVCMPGILIQDLLSRDSAILDVVSIMVPCRAHKTRAGRGLMRACVGREREPPVPMEELPAPERVRINGDGTTS